MNRNLMAAAVIAAAVQAGPGFAQTTPATPGTSAPAAPTTSPKKSTTHGHHTHHHKASDTNGFADKSLPDSTTETPTETRPK
jgi:hypothetical protein